jgi:eukaryotic-like serine/threonine-protein kinase
MDCARCGHTSPADSPRCDRCGATLADPGASGDGLSVAISAEPPTGPPATRPESGPAVSGAASSFNSAASTIVLGTVTTSGVRGVAPDVATTSGATMFGDVRLFGEGPLAVGHAFGPRYRITRVLGVGGMGAVYQAWDAVLGVPVALKVIRTDHRHVTTELEQRFKNELLLARQVTHKSVVRIHDLGEIDGIKYITMPYVDGQDLATLLRKNGRQPVATTLRIARQMADGLEAAHEAGVVHRDLKPANVMLSTGDEIHALIMDFGISTSTEHAEGGPVLGTLEYMPPEQATGGPIDARADIYTFGLIVYELLTGLRPLAGRTQQDRIEAMKQRFTEGLPPLRKVDSSIPEPVEAIVMRCLESDPAERFQTTAELTAALARLDEHGEIIPEPRRLTARVLALGLVLMVLLAAATYFATRQLLAPPIEHPPVSVLVADIENRTGESTLDGVIEQRMTSSLEGASFVTVYPRQSAVQLARKLKPGSRIDGEMARLISNSEGIGVIVSGSVERQGKGYVVSVKAVNGADGQTMTEERARAADRSKVIAAVDSLAEDVRRALGDTAPNGSGGPAETFTAASLDAIAAFARAQELQQANRFEDALREYQRAIELDAGFARAYSGMAGVYSNYFRQPVKARVSYEAAMKHLDRMSQREKYRTLGTYYLDIVHNYEQARENFEALVARYPADDSGHGNLALAYMNLGRVQDAIGEVRKSLAIYPKNSLQRYNYAMYSMYAGDFATAIAEAQRVQEETPQFEYAHIPAALSQLAQGDVAAARESYRRMSLVSPLGASFASMGLADMAMYFGRHREAVELLQRGIDADMKANNATQAAQKHVALAEAYLAIGQPRRAADAAAQAAKLSRLESTLFPTGLALARAGRDELALQIATDLDKLLQRQTTAYAGVIRAAVALQHGRVAEGIEELRAAQQRRDSWTGRFLLGKAYVEADHFAEAFTELELSFKRRGETTDVFFFDMPTLRYLPPLYYWLGRAQQALGASAEAQKSYEQFLALRATADPPDPLAADARTRVRQ